MSPIYAPRAYRDAPASERSQHCNGCGPKSAFVDIVPDSIWGLDVSEACNIHDWMYAHGRTIEDKREADRTFLNNMLRMIENAGGWSLLRLLRRRRALKYFWAVDVFGGPAFWDSKNP